MFDELNKYSETGHFFLMPAGALDQVCNAPTDRSGVYIVYALKNGKIELVYIGRSGEVTADGTMFIRKGGIKDRLVNGKQFGIRRTVSWPNKMREDEIEALDIYWYVTHSDTYSDCPRTIEVSLLQKHLDLFGSLPEWNRNQ